MILNILNRFIWPIAGILIGTFTSDPSGLGSNGKEEVT